MHPDCEENILSASFNPILKIYDNHLITSMTLQIPPDFQDRPSGRQDSQSDLPRTWLPRGKVLDVPKRDGGQAPNGKRLNFFHYLGTSPEFLKC